MVQREVRIPFTACILSLVGGILMLISALRTTLQALYTIRFIPNYSQLFIGMIGLIVSITVILITTKLPRVYDVPSLRRMGMELLILSILGYFTASGFTIGFILLLIGSIATLIYGDIMQ